VLGTGKRLMVRLHIFTDRAEINRTLD